MPQHISCSTHAQAWSKHANGIERYVSQGDLIAELSDVTRTAVEQHFQGSRIDLSWLIQQHDGCALEPSADVCLVVCCLVAVRMYAA